MNKQNTLLISITLMLVIVIDAMGWGLVLPVFPDLFFNPASSFLPPDLSLNARDWYYGICFAAWPVGLFIGSPYFGDMSDKLGRKNIIVICLLGTMATYWLSAVAIGHHGFTLLLIARVLSGFFSGSFPIAQAMMIDISDQHTKSRNLLLLTLASSFGFLCGPIITGVVTMHVFSGFFTLLTPFYLAAILTLINIIAILLLLPKTKPTANGEKVHLLRSIFVIKEVLVDTRTRHLLVAFVLLFIGWGFYCSVLALFLYQLFAYSSSQIAALYAVMAISSITVTVFFSKSIFTRFDLKPICVVSGVLLSILLMFTLNTHAVAAQWLVAALAPGVQLMFYTAIITMFSNAVGPEEQGRVMGGADATVSVAFFINNLLLGGLVQVSLLLPLAAASISILCSVLYLAKRVKQQQIVTVEDAP